MQNIFNDIEYIAINLRIEAMGLFFMASAPDVKPWGPYCWLTWDNKNQIPFHHPAELWELRWIDDGPRGGDLDCSQVRQGHESTSRLIDFNCPTYSGSHVNSHTRTEACTYVFFFILLKFKQ